MTRFLRNKKTIPAFAAGLAVTLALAACSSTPSDNTSTPGPTAEGALEGVTITLADHAPDTHPIVVGGVEPFIEAVEEAGGTVEYFGNGELSSATDMLSTVQSNVANIAAVIFTYFPNDFPEAGVAELPGSFGTAVEGTEYLLEFMEAEMGGSFENAGTVPIFTTAFPVYQLATNEKLATPADVEGMVFRAAGGAVSQSVTALGAAPVSIPITDQYVALQRGTVDGVVGAFNQMTPYKTQEVVKYVTSNLQMGTSTVSWMANRSWYDSLTSEQQDALKAIGEDISAKVSAHLDKIEAAERDVMVAAGVEVYEIKDVAPWNSALSGVGGAWAAQVSTGDIDGEALLASWQTIVGQQ